MVSLGGMYSYLQAVLPELERQGCSVGLLWSARVSGASFPEIEWQRELHEEGSLPSRQRDLRAAVIDAARAFAPDVVVSLLPQSDIACAIAGRRLSMPWAAMIHGQPYPARGEQRESRRLPWQLALSWTYARADRVLAVSEELGASLRRELQQASVQVVHNGIALPASTPPPTGGAPIVGFVGRLSPEKAPDIFVELVQQLGVRARLFGDGPLRQEVEAAIAPTPLVELKGWSRREDAFTGLDLLVLTSRREGLPLVALESGAYGRCVVARRIGGVPEVFERDAELAKRCLVPADATVADFARAVRPLLGDHALRADLGARLRAVVKEGFQLDRQVERLVSALPWRAAGRG